MSPTVIHCRNRASTRLPRTNSGESTCGRGPRRSEVGLAHEYLGHGVFADPHLTGLVAEACHRSGQLVLQPLAQAPGQLRIHRRPGRARGAQAVDQGGGRRRHGTREGSGCCHLPSMTGRCDTGERGSGPRPCIGRGYTRLSVNSEDRRSDTTHGIDVTEATEATPELLEALHRLVPQLSSSASPLTRIELEEIVGSAATILLVARDGDGRIVGTLSLIVFRAPTGLRAWIEDVVVDDDTRGLGVGAALVRAGIARGRAAGAQTVDLTSRPSREEANRLYLREGFVQRTTNVYRYEP